MRQLKIQELKIINETKYTQQTNPSCVNILFTDVYIYLPSTCFVEWAMYVILIVNPMVIPS
jgi:hypothetical protein